MLRNSLVILISSLVWLALPLSAQNGQVSGRVVDSQGSVIPKARVTLTNTATNFVVDSETNNDGYFQAPPVPPGAYEVKTEAPGFAVSRLTGITLEVEESKVVTITLQPATVRETVTVADTAPGPHICNNCEYFNPAAFSKTPEFALGNVSRYLPDVSLPTGKNWDTLIEKGFVFRERYRLMFRGELLNAFNLVTFAGPTTSVTSTSFGYISLSQTNTPRNVQLSMRVTF